MPISVRLPPRVEQQLAEYCAQAKVTKSEAVKRALEGLFRQSESSAGVSAAARRFVGSDKRAGDVARRTKRLLKQHFRGE
jgi:predicted DNA-binding protein